MSAQSDRIRAALSRSGAARPVVNPRLDPVPVPANVEPTLPAIAVNTENLEALLRSDAASSEPRILGVSTEIEDTLRLIAATDEERVALHPTGTAWNGQRTTRRQRSSLTPILVAFALILAVAGAVAYAYRDRWLSTPKTSARVAENNFPLQVKAEPQGNGLIDVRWNPQSVSIAHARGGRLVIQELGQPPRVVELNPEQLRIGHVSYQSSAESLELRLEVVDGSGETAKESVLALSPRGNAPPQAEPPPPPGRVEAAPIPIPEVAVAQPASPARPVARPFSPPAKVQNAATEGLVAIEPLAVTPTGPVSVPIAGAPELPRQPPPPKPAPTQTAPVRIGGNIQDSKLIKKVTPIYPFVAKSAGVQGTVRFEAIISKTGAIRDVQVKGGPPALIEAATNAVKQWMYRPTLLNGEPIEVVTQIEVTFSLH